MKADGTTSQTLTSTTDAPAGQWTLLELNDQKINDDIVDIDFRMIVDTNAKYVYFDAPRVTGQNQLEYLLPITYQDTAIDEKGGLYQVYIQTRGYSEWACDDLYVRDWERLYQYRITNDGTYNYLKLPVYYTENRQIKLIGIKPLEAVSSYAGTVSIDGQYVNKLVAYAKYKLFQQMEGTISSEDASRPESLMAKAYGEYMRLAHLRMTPPKATMQLGMY